jgi:hypothetical protein
MQAVVRTVLRRFRSLRGMCGFRRSSLPGENSGTPHSDHTPGAAGRPSSMPPHSAHGLLRPAFRLTAGLAIEPHAGRIRHHRRSRVGLPAGWHGGGRRDHRHAPRIAERAPPFRACGHTCFIISAIGSVSGSRERHVRPLPGSRSEVRARRARAARKRGRSRGSRGSRRWRRRGHRCRLRDLP